MECKRPIKTNGKRCWPKKQPAEEWEQKCLHVERKRTRQWLRSAGIKAEKKKIILASHDQLLPTRNYQGIILTNEADPKCGICDELRETIYRLASGYSVLTPE